MDLSCIRMTDFTKHIYRYVIDQLVFRLTITLVCKYMQLTLSILKQGLVHIHTMFIWTKFITCTMIQLFEYAYSSLVSGEGEGGQGYLSSYVCISLSVILTSYGTWVKYSMNRTKRWIRATIYFIRKKQQPQRWRSGLERSPRKRKVWYSNSSSDRPKS